MKYLKKFAILIILILVNHTVNAQTESYFQENIAITDLEAVKLTDGTFFYQLRLKDFGKGKLLPEGFGISGYSFMDNGQFNDAVAGDGIYAAQQTLDSKLLKSQPITKTTFYDQKFKHNQSLLDSGGTTINDGVGCRFRLCGCPCSSYPCPVCELFGWSCWEPYDCEIFISIE